MFDPERTNILINYIATQFNPNIIYNFKDIQSKNNDIKFDKRYKNCLLWKINDVAFKYFPNGTISFQIYYSNSPHIIYNIKNESTYLNKIITDLNKIIGCQYIVSTKAVNIRYKLAKCYDISSLEWNYYKIDGYTFYFYNNNEISVNDIYKKTNDNDNLNAVLELKKILGKWLREKLTIYI